MCSRHVSCEWLLCSASLLAKGRFVVCVQLIAVWGQRGKSPVSGDDAAAEQALQCRPSLAGHLLGHLCHTPFPGTAEQRLAPTQCL